MSYVYKNSQLIRSDRNMSKTKTAKTWGTMTNGMGQKHDCTIGDKVMAEGRSKANTRSGVTVPVKANHVAINRAQKDGGVPVHLSHITGRGAETTLNASQVFDEASRLGKSAVNGGTGTSGYLHGTGPSNGKNAGAGTHGAAMGMKQRNPQNNIARDGRVPKRVTVAQPANKGASAGPILGWKA